MISESFNELSDLQQEVKLRAGDDGTLPQAVPDDKDVPCDRQECDERFNHDQSRVTRIFSPMKKEAMINYATSNLRARDREIWEAGVRWTDSSLESSSL